MVHGCAVCQVRKRVRQIDCVTVKGSNRPMGLFTYDVTLDAVPLPNLNAAAGPAAYAPTRRDSVGSNISLNLAALGDASASPDPTDPDSDVASYSLSAYNWEFSDHPDLACTWAVDQPFLDRFAEVRIALLHHGNDTVHACIYSARVPAHAMRQWSQLKYAHNRN